MVLWQRIPLALKIAVPGLLIVFLVATGKSDPIPNSPPPVPEKKTVPVVEAKPSTHRVSVFSQGTVEPRRRITLAAEVSGRIVEVDAQFVDGGFFDQGQILIRIEDSDYQAALLQARARVAEAQQALATELGQARQARREWRDLGNANANELFLRKPHIAAARARLKAAQGDLAKAQKDLQRTRISVPFSGRIDRIHVDLGQYVSAGTELASVYDNSTVQIRLPLSDEQLGLLSLPMTGAEDGDETRVTIEGVIGREPHEWAGKIFRTAGSVDNRSRMIYAIAEVNNQGDVPLMVGMFVEARVQSKPLANVIELPRGAIFQRNRIYTLDNNDRVVPVEVEVLSSDETTVWIRASVHGNARVMASRQSFVSPGQQVLPRSAEVLALSPAVNQDTR
ncbi:efflux RND transporter periplasmic adaptor subunit [Pseudomaricurvus alkylphenolicus]|jgi:RND family efflux transporter MFP subunit|uniref:efflux RND transporter periplasmic adaptor subunit n=1 Tax=Pseudomaricurvus alkylphenolicus TaxID=1306991 RepID=UPI00141DA345|nr:efflux RND transporter periplasmic adaptor subunit [Pseudomaricurvus alkylphenolicus]NIB41646.1 efflux RND transporter periplasmic adaptor subunit [Pseudomaricurvus alkylphenolicus]